MTSPRDASTLDRSVELSPVGQRNRTRTTGILFLAFLVYGVGASLALGTAVELGITMMLANSAIVITIGILLYPVLVRYSRPIALTYLITRIVEAVALGIGAIGILFDPNLSGTFYQLGMTVLGIGSLPFCWLLLKARLVPSLLAVWGIVGYAIFATGSILELLGLTGVGVWFLIVGGLFEVVFGVWMIARGLSPRPATSHTRR